MARLSLIGVNKAIIAVNIGFMNLIMYNPETIKKEQPFPTEESCLSLVGVRKCTRYKEIEVRYQDVNFKQQCQRLAGEPRHL
ncbi:MAG: peptide deformylase [Clostridiales bacterium]|nr:peptide deformylase [Clostridiales bacterium]